MGNVASRWQENQFNGQERFNNEVVPALVDRWHSESPNAWWRPGSPNAWWENYQPGSSKGGASPAPISNPVFNPVQGPPPSHQMGTPDVSAFNPVQGPPPSHQVAAPTTIPSTSNVVQPPQTLLPAAMPLPQAPAPTPAPNYAIPQRGFNPYARNMTKGGGYNA